MRRQTIVIVSDFEIGKDGNPQTGYSNIACTLANEIHRKHNVMALGISYQRNQHNNIFGITQVHPKNIVVAIDSIQKSLKVDHVIIILDIPTIGMILPRIKMDGIKYTGIFAVEGDPISFSWAMDLSKLDYKFPISQFGEDECVKVGIVDAKHLVIPLDKSWRQRTKEEHKNIKEALGLGDKKVLLCNVDNQERKNLGSLLEAMRLLDDTHYLNLITRKDSPVGWKFDELIMEFGIQNKVNLIERGLPLEELWKLYAASDFFILTSKAEGLNLPILEAQAVGVPVIATDCTAVHEHISDGKGIPLIPDYLNRDVFGNARRYFVSDKVIADTISEATSKPYETYDPMITLARMYVESKKIESAVNQVLEVIGNVEEEQTKSD